jgi:hypothetical protein
MGMGWERVVFLHPALPAIMEGRNRRMSSSSSEKAGWAGHRMAAVIRLKSRVMVNAFENERALFIFRRHDKRLLIVRFLV